MVALKGKWKAFQALNYINTAVWLLVLVMTIANLYDLASSDLPIAREMYLFISLSIFAFLFCFLNVHVIHKYYPSRKLNGFLKVAYIIGVIFWFGMFLLFMIAFVYGFNQEFISRERAGGVQGKFILLIVGLLMTASFLLAFWQIQLMGFLRKNSELQLQQIVDSIGMEKNEYE